MHKKEAKPQGILPVPATESRRTLFRAKFDQTSRAGIQLLETVRFDPFPPVNGSRPLAQLARQQYEFEGFDTALATLSHPKIDSKEATKQALKIAKQETELGNREHAVAMLDLAVKTAERIPDDRDGRGSQREYPEIACRYALLGEGKKVTAMVEKLDPDLKESTLFSTVGAFAGGGHDDLAFEAVEKLSKKHHMYGYGEVAAIQAERGDIAAWQDTVDTKIGDNPEGLHSAYMGLATHYSNLGNIRDARAALLRTNRELNAWDDQFAPAKKDGLVKFALEKMHDPDTALTIAREMEPDVSGVYSLLDVAKFMLANDRPADAGNVIALADAKAESIVETRESYQYLKPFAQLRVADLYLQAGQKEKGMKKITAIRSVLPALKFGGDQFNVAEMLIQDECFDTALQIIPDFEKPITQAVLYEKIVDRMLYEQNDEGNNIERKLSVEEKWRARQILDRAAAIVISEAGQGPTVQKDYLISHLIGIGSSYADLGYTDVSKEYLNMVSNAILQSSPEKRSDYFYNIRELASMDAASGNHESAVAITDCLKDPYSIFKGYVDIAKILIDSRRTTEAHQVLAKAEGLAYSVDPVKYVGGVPGDPQLMLATQYYRLTKLSDQDA